MSKPKRIGKKPQRVLDDLREVMKQYPDGTITDVIGANRVYKLINRAVFLCRKAGFTEEEIVELIEQQKPGQEPESKTVVDPCAPGEHIPLQKGGKTS